MSKIKIDQWTKNFKKNNYRKSEDSMASHTIIYSQEPIIDGSEFDFEKSFFAGFFEKDLENPKFFSKFIKLDNYSDSDTVDFSFIVGELSTKDFEKYLANLSNANFDKPKKKKLWEKIYSYYAYIVYSPELE